MNAAMDVRLIRCYQAVRLVFTVSLKWRPTRLAVDGMMLLVMAVMSHLRGEAYRGRVFVTVCECRSS
jgi:hypothetical protein